MSKRDYRLDKAKGLLIFLVVVGHLLEEISGWSMGYSRVILTAIYGFHMPAFVFLAGITAKSDRLAERVLVFLVFAVTTQPVYYWWTELFQKPPDIEFAEPYWITWFLVAMVWWLLSLPLIERFPRFMLVASIAIGVLGGVQSIFEYQLSIGRAMTFFPYFVIGKLYGKRLLEWSAQLSVTKKLGMSALAVVPIAMFFLHDIDRRWFYGARGFEFFDEAIPYGVGMRVLVATGAIAMVIVMLAWSGLLPNSLIVVGQRSLAIYLLHGLIIRAVEKPLDWLLVSTSGSVEILLCLVLAAAVTLLLAWSPFDRALRWYRSGLAQFVTNRIALFTPSRSTARH
ncbi:acyltransferase family protein [Brevibacterium epidermidis]|jgi:fucose 4-O-acetylase-like acetyltransferase|uniref:acyltransferase family protein n=1 Tax=Brevibacterium epidermidis TaxID=1698 RepID=UPI000BF5E889|nr:acyltransferase family protein [Brevibacterium epidermidis]